MLEAERPASAKAGVMKQCGELGNCAEHSCGWGEALGGKETMR